MAIFDKVNGEHIMDYIRVAFLVASLAVSSQADLLITSGKCQLSATDDTGKEKYYTKHLPRPEEAPRKNMSIMLCKNGGVYTEELGCICPPGYRGQLCEEEAPRKNMSIMLCKNGGVYTEELDCICPPGYRGQLCEEESWCDPNPCSHGDCHISGANYSCTCIDGFTGRNCDAIQEIIPQRVRRSETEFLLCNNSDEAIQKAHCAKKASSNGKDFSLTCSMAEGFTTAIPVFDFLPVPSNEPLSIRVFDRESTLLAFYAYSTATCVTSSIDFTFDGGKPTPVFFTPVSSMNGSYSVKIQSPTVDAVSILLHLLFEHTDDGLPTVSPSKESPAESRLFEDCPNGTIEGQAGEPITWNEPKANDSAAEVISIFRPGMTFPAGTWNVTYYLKKDGVYIDSCSFRLKVNEGEARRQNHFPVAVVSVISCVIILIILIDNSRLRRRINTSRSKSPSSNEEVPAATGTSGAPLMLAHDAQNGITQLTVSHC